MEGFVTEPTIEEHCHFNQASKLKNFRDPLDNFDPEVSDLSFADSFLDFDSIKEFFEYNPHNQDSISFEMSAGMAEEEKTRFGDGYGCVAKAEGLECDKEKNLNSCIEEEMGKVSLSGVKGEIVSDEGGCGDVGSGLDTVDGSGEKREKVSDKNENESDSESEEGSSTSLSSFSSSSSSSDDDEEEEDEEEKEEMKVVKREVEVPGELEDGEIVGGDGEMDGGDDNDGDEEENEEGVVDGIDAEFDEDENKGAAMEGPIRSKNERQVLPPVSNVSVSLEPHHQMLPVGVVLSVLGVQVIVEGVETHNPLNEGSILWITESRSPLGLIDEIFGPVKNLYYVVRYNSESETLVGFV